MIDVSCALIRNESQKVLVVQRGEDSDHPLKWEFPGGKIDRGESAEDAVLREVDEELSMKIVIVGSLSAVEYDYGHKQIRLIPFLCDTLLEKPVLTEHVAFMWVEPSQLMALDFSAADIEVAREYWGLYGRAEAGTADSVPADAGSVLPVSGDLVGDDELKDMIYRVGGSSEAHWIAASAAGNPLLFRKLIDFTGEDDKRLVFRAAWALTKICDLKPSLFTAVIPEITERLLGTDNESVSRSFLKILSATGIMELNDDLSGRLIDHCFTLLRSPSSAIAVKAYSIDVLYAFYLVYPGLGHEIAAIAGMLPEDAPAGVRAKYREVLRKISSGAGD